MKKIVLFLFCLTFTFTIVSQSKWRQKNARINFVVTPEGQISKVAGTYSPLAGLSAAISFNDTWYAGVYGTKKVLPAFTDYPVAPGVNYDASYQHAGIDGMYSMKLGLYRTKGGHYVKRKTRVTYGLRLGVGMMWLDTETVKLATRTDYFGYVQPSVGVLYPLNDFISINGGAYFSSIIKLNVLDQYFTSNDFMSPGAFIGVKFNIFR